MDARRPGANLSCAGPAARAGARNIPGDWRGIRRARRYVRANCAGVGRLELAASGQNPVESRRIHPLPSQAAPDQSAGEVGRDPLWLANRHALRSDRRCRRLQLHIQQGAWQRAFDRQRRLRSRQHSYRHLCRLHQQHPFRGISRFRRSSGAVCSRRADESAGGGAEYGPAGDPLEEQHRRGQHWLGGHAIPARRQHAASVCSLRRRIVVASGRSGLAVATAYRPIRQQQTAWTRPGWRLQKCRLQFRLPRALLGGH